VGIAVLTWAFGLSARLRFEGEEQARAAWLRHWPEDHVAAVHIAPDGAAALIETDGGTGVVFAMGADSSAHRLDGAEVREMPTGLRIRFHDFATPRLDVTLPPEARARWRETLSETV